MKFMAKFNETVKRKAQAFKNLCITLLLHAHIS